jgi:hypothetical protein
LEPRWVQSTASLIWVGSFHCLSKAIISLESSFIWRKHNLAVDLLINMK